MGDAETYRRLAAECRELAEHSPVSEFRGTWRELEECWLRLAAEADKPARSGPVSVVVVYPGASGNVSAQPADGPQTEADINPSSTGRGL